MIINSLKTLKQMKTITLNRQPMNLKLVVSLLAILILPITVIAQQDPFDKYSANPNVTYVSIKPKMFQMIAKMGISVDDPEAKAYMDMVNSITSFKTIVTDNKTIGADVSKWVKSRSRALEELMEVKEHGSEVKFYVKEGKDADHVEELLIFVNGVGNYMKEGVEVNGEQRKVETVIVSLTGNIDLNEMSKLTSKMNIPGAEHLDKKK